MEVTSVICIDSHSVYHFEYPIFLSLPDLMIEVISSNDLKKNRHCFFKSTVDVT